ncbi:hypothetical protein MHYP_G00030600 [Metynnis hypsauchen]
MMEQHQKTKVGKRKRPEEGCSQAVLQETENGSAKKRPVAVLEVPDTEGPARKKRKGAEEQPRRRSPRQRKDAKPDTFATRYVLGEKLGEGGFGSVFKGRRISDSLQVAIKIVQKLDDDRYVQSPVELKDVPVEVALLQIMNRPPICKTIIQLIEWFDEPDRYILILERPDPCKSLDSFLQDHGGYVTEDMARDIMLQTVVAAFQCSKRGVLHRDIKLENLLINPDTLAVKLIDFGCGDLIKKSGYDIFEGTVEYCPPEFFRKGRYHADPTTVWSLGVLMFRMVCGYLPFAKDDITSGALHFRDGLSNVGKRKRPEEGCSQAVLQETENGSAKKRPVAVLEVPDTEGPARKKRKGAEEQPRRRSPRQRKDAKPDTFATRYVLGEKLGEGGFGSVFKGRRISDSLQVAIKIVQKLEDDRYVQSPVELKDVPVEVALLQIMNRPPICKTIIQLIEWFDEPDRYILILERPDPCKSLDSFLQDHGGYVTEDMARDIMLQTVVAAFQCSKRGVLHRDIKLENLLINPDTLALKLIDFGCGDLIKKSGYDIFEGTVEYCPPEFFRKGRYHADPTTVWSLGVLMFRMVCGYLPFAKDDITSGALHFRDGLSNECCDLIRWCLTRNPTRRPNLQRIQQHYWLRCNKPEILRKTAEVEIVVISTDPCTNTLLLTATMEELVIPAAVWSGDIDAAVNALLLKVAVMMEG